jgi:hypothetical protein
MTGVLAAARPDEWNFPLLVHIVGAMILVGGLLAGASILGFARGDLRSLRLGYWTLLAVALPGLILMRVGAGWIYSKYEDVLQEGSDDPTWISIGMITADAGGLLFLISLAVGGFGIYRLRGGKGAGLLKATMVLSVVLLAAYVVTVWAMAGKPD